jgi:ACS family hexuronate transporter-like MFS transporter
MGGVCLGQLAGYLLDHGTGYGPILAVAGSLHVVAFAVLLVTVRPIRPLLAE